MEILLVILLLMLHIVSIMTVMGHVGINAHEVISGLFLCVMSGVGVGSIINVITAPTIQGED